MTAHVNSTLHFNSEPERRMSESSDVDSAAVDTGGEALDADAGAGAGAKDYSKYVLDKTVCAKVSTRTTRD